MRIRDLNKEKIIRQKALKMIVREGFDGFSMQKLARAAGVSPGTLYIYFKNKEDLILQLCAEEGKKMSEATLKNFDSSMPFNEGLKLQWINRAKYSLKNPEQAEFLEKMKHSTLLAKSGEIFGDNFKKIMNDFVSNAINKNELIEVPIEVYWSVAFAPLYNLVKFQKTGMSVGGNKFVFSEEIMMKTLDLVLKALKP